MQAGKTFKGLGRAERKVLTDWLAGAGARGIDTIVDLSSRPWNIGGESLIVGVFETDKATASWLVVRKGTDWTIARCSDGFVSDVATSLPDALASIDRDTVV